MDLFAHPSFPGQQIWFRSQEVVPVPMDELAMKQDAATRTRKKEYFSHVLDGLGSSECGTSGASLMKMLPVDVAATVLVVGTQAGLPAHRTSQPID